MTTLTPTPAAEMIAELGSVSIDVTGYALVASLILFVTAEAIFYGYKEWKKEDLATQYKRLFVLFASCSLAGLGIVVGSVAVDTVWDFTYTLFAGFFTSQGLHTFLKRK